MRTRRALTEAAQRLIAAGSTPTVSEAADAAFVSRATAYRYFPTQAALLVEAALLPGLPTVQGLLRRPESPSAAADRVALVSRSVFAHVGEREREFRLYLRERLQRDVAAVGGSDFVPPFIDAALEPIAASLPPAVVGRLRQALVVLTGPEAVLACRDVLLLDDETAAAALCWACVTLVEMAMAEGGDSGG